MFYRSKSNLKHHDSAMKQSKDDLKGNNVDAVYDEDTTSANVGIHNMSTASETSMAAIEVHDEKVETERSDKQDEDCLEELVRGEVPKDTLRTTESGNIVKNLPYTIPRKQR